MGEILEKTASSDMEPAFDPGKIIDVLAKRAASQSREAPGDYRDEDGLLRCGTCHGKKETVIHLFDQTRVVPCVCQCPRPEREARRRRHIAELRERGGISPSCTFERMRETRELGICRRYAEHWDEACEKNAGLLLWGGVGTGKTCAAHCVANALIERDIAACATSIPQILNAGFDRSAALRRMRGAPLVILDDLGAERSSTYAAETTFLLIDERCRAGKPLIVTTNLSLDELRSPPNLERQRIYDRVLSMCVPLKFSGESRRAAEAGDKHDFLAALLTDS